MQISVIVSTYNRPDALNLVLQSLNQQTDRRFEVVVADDGSKDETRMLVEQFKQDFSVPISHVWHEDKGFRAAAIRNLAVNHCVGDYLIFLDGDCIVQSDFISRHRCLSEENCLVTGSRVLFDQALTTQILSSSAWDFDFIRNQLFSLRIKGSINKFFCFYVKFCNASIRYYKTFQWRGIKSCNLACWRNDFKRIQGYDESFEGWGHEDADFVFRLHTIGVRRKSGAFATEVLHLYHPEHNRSQADSNKSRVLRRIADFSER